MLWTDLQLIPEWLESSTRVKSRFRPRSLHVAKMSRVSDEASRQLDQALVRPRASLSISGKREVGPSREYM